MPHPLQARLPNDWATELFARVDSEACRALFDFEARERSRTTVFPPPDEVFAAFFATPFSQVRVALLGQDPYHGPGQAHGLAFSVRDGVKRPPSLSNMFKELAADVGCAPAQSGRLDGWARQGVLLLNTVLTVPMAEPNAHAGHGWEAITDAAIDALSARRAPLVFLLLGTHAQKKAQRIDTNVHRVVRAPHPSPLSAHRGFFGSRPFSSVNRELAEMGQPAIDWCATSA